MSKTIIRAEGLGKKYSICHEKREKYIALRDVVADTASRVKQRLMSSRQLRLQSREDFWALQDISVEVKQGDRIGIIGRNGAGKSTLLKILSRITEPTTGFIELRGRVASLLEVGTGFHPELTGRENIFLNGAILGMGKREIYRKFDEIVAFSEVERFLDTPVKRYSSGMYVRLAFAVAAHLEPEILIVDEVLAVGDAQFQKKCLGKMKDVGKEGRTVLFVSHNMGAIESLCQKCLLLEKGRVKTFSEDISHTIREYLTNGDWTLQKSLDDRLATKTDYFELLDVKLISKGSTRPSRNFLKTETIAIKISIDIFDRMPSLSIGYAIYQEDQDICLWWSFHVDVEEQELPAGINELTTEIPSATLNNGKYRIELLAALHNQKWLLAPRSSPVFVRFEVQGGQIGSPLLSSTSRPGVFLPAHKWQVSSSLLSV